MPWSEDQVDELAIVKLFVYGLLTGQQLDFFSLGLPGGQKQYCPSSAQTDPKEPYHSRLGQKSEQSKVEPLVEIDPPKQHPGALDQQVFAKALLTG